RIQTVQSRATRTPPSSSRSGSRPTHDQDASRQDLNSMRTATETRPQKYGASGAGASHDDHPDEMRRRFRLHLLQDARAMALDGADAQAELRGDRLGGLAAGEELEHRALARREELEARRHDGALGARFARRPVGGDRLGDAVEHVLVVEGLLEDVGGAAL